MKPDHLLERTAVGVPRLFHFHRWPYWLGAFAMRVLIALFLVVLTGCGARRHTSPASAASPHDEMEVIVSFLQQQYGSDISTNTPLVIEGTFSVMKFQKSHDEFTRSLLSDASERVPSELIRDFCDKNAKPQAVWPELGSRLNVRLLSRAELHSFFSAKAREKSDGWARFYVKFPKSPGIVSISRVGFTHGGDMAMLYVGSQRHWMTGSGQIHVLRKRAGKWVEEPVSIGPIWES